MIGTDLLLRAAARRGSVILCFHQISTAAFDEWIQSLLRAFTLISLQELVERREHQQSVSGLMAVTFDDGWADTCPPIAAMCESRGWPMTIYLIAGALGCRQRMWFAELPELLRQASGRVLDVDGEVIDLRPRALSASRERLSARLRQIPASEAIRFIDRAWASIGVERNAGVEPFVDLDFVQEYTQSGCISFGSHTVDHQALAIQSEPQVTSQLSESRRQLEELIGRPVGHFCYPYGYPISIGDAAPRIASGMYRSATTMVRGLCTDRSDPWYLPRVSLYESDSLERGLAKVALAPRR